ncbi:MAG TPA: hypothetical protein VHM70_16535 [Polyangiaceae bacterium]|nr:hypothetical protein [Polyangiaceae bacterium]
MAGRLESFLLICVPKTPAALGYDQVFRSGFLQRLEAPDFGVRLLHPTQPESRTFPFWVEPGAAAASRILVRNNALVSCFASPGRNRNLLFLAQPLAKRTPLELHPQHDSKSNFSPGAPPSFGLESSALVDEASVGLVRRMYHECPPRSGEADRWYVDLAPPSPEAAAPKARNAAKAAPKPAEPLQAHGWVNPVVLKIELEGKLFAELPAHVADTDPRAVVRRELLEHFQILAIYPLFHQADDVRFIAWEALLSGQPPQARANAVERLLLGGQRAAAHRSRPLIPQLSAFMALDQLGGSFAVYGHGSPTKPLNRGSGYNPNEALTYCWWPPAEGLAPNAEWFATQAELCWASGQPLDKPRAPAASEVLDEGGSFRFVHGPGKKPYAAPERFEEPASRLSASRQRWEPIVMNAQALLASTPGPDDDRFINDDGTRRAQTPDEHWDEKRWIRSCLPLIRREPTVVDFLFELFTEPRLQNHPFFETVRRSTRDPVRKGNDWVSEFNFEQLEETLGRDYIAPLSRVRFEIPIRLAAAGEENAGPLTLRYFDLMNSLNDGGIGLLHGLLQAHRFETNEKNRKKLVLQPSAGWWNDWHLCLFGDPAELEIEFEAAGLTLGVSRLGETPIGGSASAAAIPGVMSFTRPAPREVTGTQG